MKPASLREPERREMDSLDVVHSSHWGAFVARVRDGRVEQTRPLPADADPSPVVYGMADGITSTARIREPAVRDAAREASRQDIYLPDFDTFWADGVAHVGAGKQQVLPGSSLLIQDVEAQAATELIKSCSCAAGVRPRRGQDARWGGRKASA